MRPALCCGFCLIDVHHISLSRSGSLVRCVKLGKLYPLHLANCSLSDGLYCCESGKNGQIPSQRRDDGRLHFHLCRPEPVLAGIFGQLNFETRDITASTPCMPPVRLAKSGGSEKELRNVLTFAMSTAVSHLDSGGGASRNRRKVKLLLKTSLKRFSSFLHHRWLVKSS